MVGGDGHIIDLQAEEDRGDQSPLCHASPLVSLPTRHTSRRVTAVTLGVAEALVAVALQGSFRGRVCFHRHSEPTELVDGTDFVDFGTACNRHYKVRRRWAVLLGVLIAAPRAELRDPLDKDAKGSQLLSDDVLRHEATQILNQKADAVVLWE